jgi:hypothetical protein
MNETMVLLIIVVCSEDPLLTESAHPIRRLHDENFHITGTLFARL